VAAYSRALAERVASVSQGDTFVLLLGGDCSVVLGSLLGLRPEGAPPVGLAYVDGQADFASPEESRTGSVASMCLALAVGRGDTPLARLSAEGPLVRAEDTVLIGRRDHAEPWYGHDALKAAPLLDLPDEAVRERGLDAAGRAALERLSRPEGGFWVHVDADVLDDTLMPAVDSRTPGGLSYEALVGLLRPLLASPRAIGVEFTIYDPDRDPEGTVGRAFTAALVEALRP